MARRVMDQLVRYGEVKRGRIGVAIQDLTPDLAQAMSTDAHRAARSSPASSRARPPSSAGLRTGDLVVAVNGAAVHSGTQLRNMIGLPRIGDEVDADRRPARLRTQRRGAHRGGGRDRAAARSAARQRSAAATG